MRLSLPAHRIAKIKKTVPSLIKDMEQLSVEMKNGTMTTESSLEVSYKAKHALPYAPVNLLLGIFTQVK